MSDNYEFMRSNESQNIDEYTPYTNKQFNFVNDTNSSVYTNLSLSLVQFDLSSIYNSQTFVDTNDMFLVVPLVTVAAFSAAGVVVAPVSGNYALCSLKSSYLNLIHQCDLNIDGKTIESTQPYQNVACNFRLLSEMSQGDLKSYGPTYGFSEVLDPPNSVVFNNVNTAVARGNGFTNNLPFGITAGSAGTGTQSSLQTKQNLGAVNESTQRRLGRTVDFTSGTYNNFNLIMNESNMQNECRPYYVVKNNCMIWYDFAVIKLSSIMDSFAEIGLCKRFNSVLRLWINTGSMNITVAAPNNAALTYLIDPTKTTFTNTCPLMINHLPGASAAGGIPATVDAITAGLFIGRAVNTTVGGGQGYNLGLSAAQSNFTSCRIYYSQIVIDIPKAVSYISENRSKTVRFRNLISNQYFNIAGSFNQLVSSGIVNPLGILIVPYLNATTATNGGIAQYISPFDSAPLTTAPISLTNIQCSVGGQNQLNDTLYYTFQNFVEQVSMAENLTSADWGINCGVFSQQWWETFRYYYINVSRSAIADKQTPRNINISFTNNTQVPIDIMVFIIYADKFIIDVETGLVSR